MLAAAAATADRAAAAVEAEDAFLEGGGEGEGDAPAVNPELRDRLQRELYGPPKSPRIDSTISAVVTPSLNVPFSAIFLDAAP